MKISLTSSALVAILGLALASVPVTAQAQTSTNAATTATTAPTAATTTKPAAKKAAKTPYKGSITAIDASSVTVASTEKTLTLSITPSTKFGIKAKKDYAPATQADFAVGDAVTGSYSTDAAGATTANTVHKKAAKTAAATPAQ
jgi:hypothetical protein